MELFEYLKELESEVEDVRKKLVELGKYLETILYKEDNSNEN